MSPRKKNRDYIDVGHLVAHATRAVAQADRAATYRRSVQERSQYYRWRKQQEEKRQRERARREARHEAWDSFQADIEEISRGFLMSCLRCQSAVPWPNTRCGNCRHPRPNDEETLWQIEQTLEEFVQVIEEQPDFARKILGRKDKTTREIRNYLGKRNNWTERWMETHLSSYQEESEALQREAAAVKAKEDRRGIQSKAVLAAAKGCFTPMQSALIDRDWRVAKLSVLTGAAGGMLLVIGFHFASVGFGADQLLGGLVWSIGGAILGGILAGFTVTYLSLPSSLASLGGKELEMIQGAAERLSFPPLKDAVDQYRIALQPVADTGAVRRDELYVVAEAVAVLENAQKEYASHAGSRGFQKKADATRGSETRDAEADCFLAWLGHHHLQMLESGVWIASEDGSGNESVSDMEDDPAGDDVQEEPDWDFDALSDDGETAIESVPMDSPDLELGSGSAPAVVWPGAGENFLRALRDQIATGLPFEPEWVSEDADLEMGDEDEGELWIHIQDALGLSAWFSERKRVYVQIVIGFYSQNEVRDKRYRAIREHLDTRYGAELLPGWILGHSDWTALGYETWKKIRIDSLNSPEILQEVHCVLLQLANRVQESLQSSDQA